MRRAKKEIPFPAETHRAADNQTLWANLFASNGRDCEEELNNDRPGAIVGVGEFPFPSFRGTPRNLPRSLGVPRDDQFLGSGSTVFLRCQAATCLLPEVNRPPGCTLRKSRFLGEIAMPTSLERLLLFTPARFQPFLLVRSGGGPGVSFPARHLCRGPSERHDQPTQASPSGPPGGVGLGPDNRWLGTGFGADLPRHGVSGPHLAPWIGGGSATGGVRVCIAGISVGTEKVEPSSESLLTGTVHHPLIRVHLPDLRSSAFYF